MPFPFNNPDVDPLSQNQRIDTLESAPSGGGGNSGVLIAPDFDTYPDNSVKVYPGVGLVGKLSVPEAAQLAPGLDLKFCIYKTLINGLPLGTKLFFIRAYNPNPWTFPTSIMTQGITKRFAVDNQDFYKKYFANSRRGAGIVGVQAQSDIPFTVGSSSHTFTITWSIEVSGEPSTFNNTYVRMNGRVAPSLPVSLTMPASLTLSAGYRFSFYSQNQSNFTSTVMQEITPTIGLLPAVPQEIVSPTMYVVQLQDMLEVYKSFYPKSWTR